MAKGMGMTRRAFVRMASVAVPMAVVGGGVAANGAERSASTVGPEGARVYWVSSAWRSNPEAATLVAAIQHGDAPTRIAAVDRAPLVGSAAVMPLCELAGCGHSAAARYARQALARIVRHCARPGAGDEARSCATQLARRQHARFGAGVRAEARRASGLV